MGVNVTNADTDGNELSSMVEWLQEHMEVFQRQLPTRLLRPNGPAQRSTTQKKKAVAHQSHLVGSAFGYLLSFSWLGHRDQARYAERYR